MTVEGFRPEMKEVDRWPPSWFLAREGDGRVAVLIVIERREAACILRLGLLRGHEAEAMARSC